MMVKERYTNVKGKISRMNYDVIALACEQLSYRDKLRLAQLLIQAARKEEENINPINRTVLEPVKKVKSTLESPKEQITIEYVVERLLKLRPVRKVSLSNSIKAMYQFQGGISDSGRP
ncbi:MAG: hypothetical protein QX194_07345 [Methylococcales bacterium]